MIKKQENNAIENSISYLKMILKRLSSPYENQYAEIEDFAKYNLVDDILSDWDNYEQVVKCLLDANVIDKEIEMKFTKLVANFDMDNEELVWTLEGLEKHPFWEEQRNLAKKLLAELEKSTK